MGLNETIRENEELKREYARAIETIAKLTRKLEKLERENKVLREENETLRNQIEELKRQNRILKRAIEIALSMSDTNKQNLELKDALEQLKRSLG
jgi:FtsZ-binding cell division protein ZapB